ncbi:MAG: TIR domain-containing protein [Chromatiaceae bacterium]|nr:TIR domain-containing protein [Chromatiaceae bacterium]
MKNQAIAAFTRPRLKPSEAGYRLAYSRHFLSCSCIFSARVQLRYRFPRPQSAQLVVVIGPQAHASHWVPKQVESALQVRRPVIAIELPVDLGDSASSPMFSSLTLWTTGRGRRAIHNPCSGVVIDTAIGRRAIAGGHPGAWVGTR